MSQGCGTDRRVKMNATRRVPRSALGRDVNLSSIYPISLMVGFRHTWIGLTVAVSASIAALLLSTYYFPFLLDNERRELYATATQGVTAGLWCAWIARFAYEQLARVACYYGIEDGHFVIARGIFIRERGSFPLARITDVYLESNIMNLLLGVRTLHLATPTMLSERFARIDGLPTRVAEALQRRISRLVDQGISSEGTRGRNDRATHQERAKIAARPLRMARARSAERSGNLAPSPLLGEA